VIAVFIVSHLEDSEKEEEADETVMLASRNRLNEGLVWPIGLVVPITER
jgi:hypothetical protein